MSDDVVRINCPNDECGTFVMDRTLRDRYKRTGETFTCPAGHRQHFGETTETKLRKRVGELEKQVASYERRLESLKDTFDTVWRERNDERDRRQFVERRLFDHEDGVVEVGEERFMWACACGSAGTKAFEDERDAWDAYDAHRDRAACDAAERNHADAPA